MRKISHDQALRAYDILVEHAGARDDEGERQAFAQHVAHVERPCQEYRFQGKLGFGGKFWNDDRRETPFVNCYSENATPERTSIILKTNAALAALFPPPKFVIINDADEPGPRMVCQWVPGVGYCYLDRSRNKNSFDGMKGPHKTPIEAFGFSYEEGNGHVTFYQSGEPSTARYRDGHPRAWQSEFVKFDFPLLEPGVRGARRVAPGMMILWDPRSP